MAAVAAPLQDRAKISSTPLQAQAPASMTDGASAVESAVAHTAGLATATPSTAASSDRKASKRLSSRSNGRTGERSSKTMSNSSSKRKEKPSSRRRTVTSESCSNTTDIPPVTKNARALRKSTSLSDFNLGNDTATASRNGLLRKGSSHANLRLMGAESERVGASSRTHTAASAKKASRRSSMDATEKRKKKPQPTRKQSRRSLLLDSSSRKQPSSRRNIAPMTDASSKNQQTTLDSSRVSSSSMEASSKGKDSSTRRNSRNKSKLKSSRKAQDLPDMKAYQQPKPSQGQDDTNGTGTTTQSTTTATTQEEQNQGQNNSQEKPNDTMGFPAPSSSDTNDKLEDEAFAADFGNLPDFQVGHFSFADLNFPFGASEEDTDIKVDNAKAAELSSKQEAKMIQQDKQPKREQTQTETNDKASWVCENCQEEHDESELLFCGMCGSNRPKNSTTPKKSRRKSPANAKQRDAKKIIRRSNTTSPIPSQDDSAVKSNAIRRSNTTSPIPSQDDSAVKSNAIRRSNTTSPIPSQDDSAVKSNASSRKSAPAGIERPVSTGAARKIRPMGSKPGLTTTPRSRSKGKVRNKEKDVAMIVKCLDGDDAEAMDMEMLNQQLTTFEPLLEPPMTPMKSRKKTVRRCQSDVSEMRRVHDDPSLPYGAGRIPTSAAPQTPRSQGKKKVPSQKPAIRQAIPRRAKSTTTEYLNQLQQTNNVDSSGHSASNTNDRNTSAAGELKKSRSEHSMGALPAGAQSMGTPGMGGRPSLAGGRPSLMKSASQRLLGGLSGISNTFAIGGFSKPKGKSLNSDEEDDDDGEFDLKQTAAGNKPDETGVMLRDFSTTKVDPSKSPRPLGSARNLMANQDEGGGGIPPQTPRRRRATIAAARQAHAANKDDVTRTPRRRRNSIEARARPGMEEMEAGGRKTKNDKRSTGSKGLDYNDIDIDEDDDWCDEVPTSEALGNGTRTPRRARERVRPMARRQGPGGAAKSDHGAFTPKGLNARSRIRRASVTDFQIGALPDLDAPDASKTPPTPGTLNARGRIRRASLGTLQIDKTVIEATSEREQQVSAPAFNKPMDDNVLPAESGHGRPDRFQSVRPGRSRRRGSIENPLLQQALAHMPQDPTHAVRSDIQEEWKRQEQMEDLRKKAKHMEDKAKKLKMRYQGAFSDAAEPGKSEPLFEAEFDDFRRQDNDGDDIGDTADLDFAEDEDQDLSDLSSRDDGDEFG